MGRLQENGLIQAGNEVLRTVTFSRFWLEPLYEIYVDNHSGDSISKPSNSVAAAAAEVLFLVPITIPWAIDGFFESVRQKEQL